MAKKSKALLAALSLSVSVLGTCGNNAGTQEDAESPPASKEPVELFVYHNGSVTAEIFKEKFQPYITEKLPHVTINFVQKDKNVSLTEMISSGSTKIDIFIDSIGQIGLKGSLLDLGAGCTGFRSATARWLCITTRICSINSAFRIRKTA